MTIYHSEDLYDNNLFNLIKRDNAIILSLKKENNILISSWLNGGICYNMDNVVNQTIGNGDYEQLDDGNYIEFQKNKFIHLNLNPDKSTGLMTSACMDNMAISKKTYEQITVYSIVTAGADKNGVKAGDLASFYEYNHHYFSHFGTINIITVIDANLDDGALVTAAITATEAKTSVLQDLKVESQYSHNIATGTGTDGLCIISNKNSQNHLENAGKHSKLGELISVSIREATKKALFLQTFMSEEYQATVLSRLSRFNIYFEDFLNESSMDELSYASVFYHFNKNKRNVAFVSSIINLVDEVQLGLLEIEDISFLIVNLINSHLDLDVKNKKIENVGDITDLLIKSINQHLFDKNNG